jgi:tetratricopeptide (TPR) repeat protein
MAHNAKPIGLTFSLDQNLQATITKQNFVGNHADVMTAMNDGITLNNAAYAAFHHGDYDRAIAGFKKAIDIKLKAYGEESHHICISLSGLSDAYFKKGEIENAKRECKRMYDIATRIGNAEQLRIAKEILGEISDFEKAK